MNANIIELKNISKSYNESQALQSINLDVKNGEFLTLLGPSGCGKTTLLRLLSGFDAPDEGAMLLNGQNMLKLPSEKRHVNMVFQSYALFPHMSVYENIAFGLRCKGLPKQEIDERVLEALQMVKLDHLSQRKPHKLSGGQQQRVAIARAVVNRPWVLLLDEPLSALDYNLRKSMRIELKELQRRLGITFIFVTHDQEEALSMSDRVVVMNQGTIEQIGSPRDVYEEPANLFVAKFIGEANIFNVIVQEADAQQLKAEIEGKTFIFKNKKNFQKGQKVSIILRPEDIKVWGQTEVDDTSNMLPGVVEQAIYKGSTVDLRVRLPSGHRLSVTEFFDEDDEKLEYESRENVWFYWMPGWEVILPHEE